MRICPEKALQKQEPKIIASPFTTYDTFRLSYYNTGNVLQISLTIAILQH